MDTLTRITQRLSNLEQAVRRLSLYIVPPVLAWAMRAISVDSTVSDGVVIVVDTSGGDRVITLPLASAVKFRPYWIKNIDVNRITVTASGADLIDGAGVFIVITQYASVCVYSDGSTWHVLSLYLT